MNKSNIYYSIKTEKELEKELGINWYDHLTLHFYWNSAMDYLFGEKLYFINDNYINKNSKNLLKNKYIKIPRYKVDYDDIQNDQLSSSQYYWIIHESLFKINLIRPSYNAKKIIKESTENFLFNIPPKTLTISEQKKLFNIGEEVYIRPDADKYFRDIDTHDMVKMYGKKGIITHIENIEKKYYGYFSDFFPDNILDSLNIKDLLIYVKVDGVYNSEDYYWYYKCLVSTKIIKPTYKSKKIIKESNSFNFPYRFKTENEFIEEYGVDWIDTALDDIGWNGRMNCLFGEDFPYCLGELNFTDKINPIPDRFRHSSGNWAIHWNMLTPNIENEPKYEPRIIKR